MNLRELVRKIEDDDWYQVRQKGSHRMFQHPTKTGTVVIADHGKGKTVSKGIENSILRSAGLK